MQPCLLGSDLLVRHILCGATLLTYLTVAQAQAAGPPEDSTAGAPVTRSDTSASQDQAPAAPEVNATSAAHLRSMTTNSTDAVMAQEVQLVPGTTIVTAYNINEGDAESIKLVVSKDQHGLRFHYSSKVPTRRDVNVYRFVSSEDSQAGRVYDNAFENGERERKPGTTSLGISTEVLNALKAGTKVDASVRTIIGRNETYYPGQYEVVDVSDVPVQVILNDREVNLPAVHVRGEFGPVKGEFWFLDNPAAPISLKFSLTQNERHSDLHVVKIIVPTQQRQAIESALTIQHRVTLEGIYFDFDKATIRPESGVVLASVADVLRTNPAWHVKVEGYTDNVGTDAYNMGLSNRRARSVLQDLVRHYHISANRLTSAGYGANDPKATNETLEGRAFNRRVELVRTDAAK